MAPETIYLPIAGGSCRAFAFASAGRHPSPAVIVFMDGMGIRPALFDIAERLAAEGYVVLLPDMFHRFGPYEPLVPRDVFDGDARSIIGPMMATTGNARAAADTATFLGYLAGRPDVRAGAVGTVGFCMGGGMAITAAGHYPDVVRAAASFHGGNLATDAPDSPHRRAPAITAELYIGIADDDPHYPPGMAERMERALDDAAVVHRSELFPGAAHGWMMPDFPIYDPPAAERGWAALLDLFRRRLGNA